MSDLMTEIQALRNDVKVLTMMIMKDKIDTTWVAESDASQMFGLTPKWFRRKVLSRHFPFEEVGFRTTGGRNYQYNRKALLRAKEKSSVQA